MKKSRFIFQCLIVAAMSTSIVAQTQSSDAPNTIGQDMTAISNLPQSPETVKLWSAYSSIINTTTYYNAINMIGTQSPAATVYNFATNVFASVGQNPNNLETAANILSNVSQMIGAPQVPGSPTPQIDALAKTITDNGLTSISPTSSIDELTKVQSVLSGSTPPSASSSPLPTTTSTAPIQPQEPTVFSPST